MSTFLEALNHPINAFHRKSRTTTWVLVVFTMVVNSFFELILRYYQGSKPTIDFSHIAGIFIFGATSYLIICIILWFVCRCFGSTTSLFTYIQTWGITFFPTLLCSIVVSITETYFYVFWNNTIWGLLLNFIFVGILIWKIVLYVTYLKEIGNLNKGRLLGAFLIIGICILILAVWNGYVGIKSPVI
ncbi:MAG TPA: YIP1 family protein [Lachnospiraceae bacterium]|nr:YIP1 family protein [Lachnospiraceae bacterium]